MRPKSRLFKFTTEMKARARPYCSCTADGATESIPSIIRSKRCGTKCALSFRIGRVTGDPQNFAGELPIDFHRRAAGETLLVLDALKIDRAIFWGHSDGAVIAAMIALRAPERCERLILEAFHFYRNKPRSNNVFFQRFADHPEAVSEKLRAQLAADHGAEQWAQVVERNCRVWLRLASESTRPDEDLYDGQLGGLRVPVTFVHGRGDPRTEPGEIERACAAIPGAEIRFIENGRHSPHSEDAAWSECNGILGELVAGK